MTRRAKCADNVLSLDATRESYVFTGSPKMNVAYIQANGDLDPMSCEK